MAWCDSTPLNHTTVDFLTLSNDWCVADDECAALYHQDRAPDPDVFYRVLDRVLSTSQTDAILRGILCGNSIVDAMRAAWTTEMVHQRLHRPLCMHNEHYVVSGDGTGFCVCMPGKDCKETLDAHFWLKLTTVFFAVFMVVVVLVMCYRTLGHIRRQDASSADDDHHPHQWQNFPQRPPRGEGASTSSSKSGSLFGRNRSRRI